jgi:haloalkane dehalogenase
MTGILRTPDSCFAKLGDYPFSENHVNLMSSGDVLRMHYVDEGPTDAPVVLMLHGEPSWSYLYRKMIPVFAAAGLRAIAPDLIGFGKSDKLALTTDYSYQRHVDWIRELIVTLNLSDITLVMQDWGGPIGLRQVALEPERFSKIVVANTLLPTCQPPPLGISDWPSQQIIDWVAFSAQTPDLPIGDIMQGSTVTELSPNTVAAYNAPFPSADYKAAAQVFPALIPIEETMAGCAENKEAWTVLEKWHKPLLTAFSDSDPSTKPWETVFQQRVPGASAQSHIIIEDAGHFLQEDQGEKLAEAVLKFISNA